MTNKYQFSDGLTFSTIQFLVMLAIWKIPDTGSFLGSGSAKFGKVHFKISVVDISHQHFVSIFCSKIIIDLVTRTGDQTTKFPLTNNCVTTALDIRQLSICTIMAIFCTIQTNSRIACNPHYGLECIHLIMGVYQVQKLRRQSIIQF